MQKIAKYEIIRELGSGSTSTVYLAFDPYGRREVAIKVARPELMAHPEYGKRFRKLYGTEVALVGKLSHPHLVQIFDAGTEGNLSYLVMEYLPGGTLMPYCHPSRLLPIERAVEIGYKACRALNFAFRRGIIHRDIKPANILVDAQGEIKISDFGAAILNAAETTQVSGIGSPAFMSPEQVRDQPLTQQTDIFSMGVMLYQLLTGTLPFKATGNYTMVHHILHVDPQPPSEHRREITAALDDIIKRALQKNVANRYKDWEEFAQDLANVLNTIPKRTEQFSDSEKFSGIRKLDFFREFSDVQLWEVLRIALWKRYKTGETLIKEGDVGSSFFILLKGSVNILKQGRLLNILSEGDCCGEMSYLGKQKFQRTANVVAATDVITMEIGAETLARASEDCRHHFNGAFLGLLVDRLALANTRLSQVLLDRNISIF